MNYVPLHEFALQYRVPYNKLLIAVHDALSAAPAPAVAAEPASPMSKMAAALREKARNEREVFDARVQSGEWGPMPDAGTEADHTPEHVATVEGDDAVREMRWNPRVAAFDFAVGTKLYAQAAPAVAAEPWQPIETAPQEGEFLVFLPTARMSKVQAARRNVNGVTVIGGSFAFEREPATHWMPTPDHPSR